MLPFERSAPLPPVSQRSSPRTVQALIQAGLARSDRAAVGTPPTETSGRTPPVPATFLEPAAGGAFELFPRRQLPRGVQGGAGALIQGGLPNPLLAGLLGARPAEAAPAAETVPERAPRLRRSA